MDEQVRQALQELASDPTVPEITQADVEELSMRFRDTEGTLRAKGIDVGPKTICNIKCLVKWAICKARGGNDCNTALAECIASCYLPSAER